MKNDRNNRIDNYFLEGLEGLNVIPPADAWDKIVERLPVKTKNRSMFMWIAVAASFTLFAMVSGWLYYQNQEINQGNSIQIASKSLDEKLSSGKVENISEVVAKSQIAANNQGIAQSQDNPNLKTIRSKKETSSKLSGSSSVSASIAANSYGSDNHSQLFSNQLSTENNTNASHLVNSQVESADINGIDKVNTEAENENYVNKRIDDTFVLLSPITGQTIDAPYKSDVIARNSAKIRIDSLPVYESLYAYENIPEEKEKKDRWAIGGQMAPLYSYRNLKEVNSYGLPKSEINDIEKGVVTYSSGVIVDFEASSRLTFQTGVSYMKWGQEIDNISNSDLSLMKSAYVPKHPNGKAIPVVNSAGVIYDKSSSVNSSEPSPILSEANTVSAAYGPGNMPMQPVSLEYKDIKQSFEFLEVPFLAKYKIINRKVNVHLLGGVSTHFLVNDKSIIKTEDNVTTKGETKKVETLNYSSSVGFGVVYSLNKHIKFSLEPTFKYYLNSFNSDDNVRMHPYTFGLYSGLLFRF